MSLRNKLSQALLKGQELERDRVMRILAHIAADTRRGLDRKLMTAGEKHLAELRLKLAEALIAAIQIKVMSGEDPNAHDSVQPGPGTGDRDDHGLEPGA